MGTYFKCCAKCGNTIFDDNDSSCRYCGAKQNLLGTRMASNPSANSVPMFYYSTNSIDYYELLSTQRFGAPEKWYDVFVECELSQQPEFNINAYQESLVSANTYFNIQKNQGGDDLDRKTNILRTQKVTPKPQRDGATLKCPTCGSTNIKEISDLSRGAHALAFGLFSKTARSQFCCGNCGYKF